MYFEDFSISSSCRHFVQWNRKGWPNLVESLSRIVLNLGQWLKRCCLIVIVSFYFSSGGHFVWRSGTFGTEPYERHFGKIILKFGQIGTIWAILVEGLSRNICVKFLSGLGDVVQRKILCTADEARRTASGSDELNIRRQPLQSNNIQQLPID